MSRRTSILEDLFNILVKAPWQVGAVITAVWLILLLIYKGSIISLFFMVLAGVSALATVGALIKLYLNGRLFDGTNSLQEVKKLSWWDFERLVGEYYRRKGFKVEGLGGNGPDGGIDVIAKRQDGEKIIIQCKHWKAFKVPVQVVRELYGVMVDKGGSGAAVITSGHFTADAVAFAKGKPIELIDGANLARLIAEVKVVSNSKPDPVFSQSFTPSGPATGMPRKSRAVLIPTEPPPLTKEEKEKNFMPPGMRAKIEAAEKAFTDANPVCQHCGKRMVLRIAQKGPTPGGKFWGCVNYPVCRHTLPFQA